MKRVVLMHSSGLLSKMVAEVLSVFLQSYMEDHLKNKNRLDREWEALCSYQAEPSTCSVGQGEQNSKRNRADAVVVCKSDVRVSWMLQPCRSIAFVHIVFEPKAPKNNVFTKQLNKKNQQKYSLKYKTLCCSISQGAFSVTVFLSLANS